MRAHDFKQSRGERHQDLRDRLCDAQVLSGSHMYNPHKDNDMVKDPTIFIRSLRISIHIWGYSQEETLRALVRVCLFLFLPRWLKSQTRLCSAAGGLWNLNCNVTCSQPWHLCINCTRLLWLGRGPIKAGLSTCPDHLLPPKSNVCYLWKMFHGDHNLGFLNKTGAGQVWIYIYIYVLVV